MAITAVVLAAGSSRRLGAPKQLLSYENTTLLGATLDMARRCRLSEIVVTLGAASEKVRNEVGLTGCTVVESPGYEAGCSSSIRAAVATVDPSSSGIVLLLGDQPGVLPSTVQALVAAVTPGVTAAPIGICRYDDGLGHPFFFHRDLFGALADLHGDKAVWKLLESGTHPVTEVRIDGPVPLDVDTWEDYERLTAASRRAEVRG